jgi:hypothetical protein
MDISHFNYSFFVCFGKTKENFHFSDSVFQPKAFHAWLSKKWGARQVRGDNLSRLFVAVVDHKGRCIDKRKKNTYTSPLFLVPWMRAMAGGVVCVAEQ